MGFTVAIGSLVLGGASAYEQHQASKKSAAAQEQAVQAQQQEAQAQQDQLALQRKQADIQNARQLRAAVRQTRIARASIVNAGGNTGTMLSSGVEGGASSVVSQNQANMDYFNSMGDLNNKIIDTQQRQGQAAAAAGQAMGEAAIAQAKGGEWGAIGSLAGTVFSASGGFTTVFGGNKPGQVGGGAGR